MTSSEKLIGKEFTIKSEQELYISIEKKSQAFLKDNFANDKATYQKNFVSNLNPV